MIKAGILENVAEDETDEVDSMSQATEDELNPEQWESIQKDESHWHFIRSILECT